MPSVTLYFMAPSPPCRSVLLTASQLGVKLNLKEVNVPQGEHLSDEFIRMNPEHTIPTIKDGDLILWESRAIQAYLANTYGKDESFYPTEPKARSKVDRLMFFDAGVLYKRFTDYVFPVAFGDEELDPTKKEKLEEALSFLEKFLSEGTAYVASNSITIADHCIVVSVTSVRDCNIIDISKYKRITEWLARCETEIPDYDELNKKPGEMFGQYVQQKLQKNLVNSH